MARVGIEPIARELAAPVPRPTRSKLSRQQQIGRSLDRVVLYLCITGILGAQPSKTQISDVWYTQIGQPFNGSVSVVLSTPSGTSNTASILTPVFTSTIRNGIINFSLVPNDTLVPAKSVYVFSFSSGDVQYCTIPTSSTPIKLANVCTESKPGAATPTFPLSWVNLSGYGNNVYCIQVTNGVGMLTTSCPGGGGGSGVSETQTWAQIEIGQAGSTNLLSALATWAQIESLIQISGNLVTATMTWAQIEAM